MPFIRLSDNYIDHPKILALSDRAFRLWHEGMAYSRKHQTDGLLPPNVIEGFRHYQAKAVTELNMPWTSGAHPLWDADETTGGYRIHDYLFWNYSKEESDEGRKDTKERVRLHRERKRNGVTDGVTNTVTGTVTNAVVLSTATDTDLVQEKDRVRNPTPVLASRTPQRVDARSRWPIFKGRRLTVFDFHLEDLTQMLGVHAAGFAWDQWFYDMDAVAIKTPGVLPQKDCGKWLQNQMLLEVKRRGLPIEGEKVGEDPYENFPKAWMCTTCGEVHEGTRAQAKLALCLGVAS